MNNAFMLISTWQGKIPNTQAFALQKKLEECDESDLNALSMVRLKEPFVGLLLGILLGFLGADRFYKEDIGLGVGKLLLSVSIIGLFVVWIWVIVDLFLVYDGIKQDNYRKIAQALSFVKNG